MTIPPQIPDPPPTPAQLFLDELWHSELGEALGYCHLTRRDYETLRKLLGKVKDDDKRAS